MEGQNAPTGRGLGNHSLHVSGHVPARLGGDQYYSANPVVRCDETLIWLTLGVMHCHTYFHQKERIYT